MPTKKSLSMTESVLRDRTAADGKMSLFYLENERGQYTCTFCFGKRGRGYAGKGNGAGVSVDAAFVL